jgi:hypothetical protein
MSLVSEYICDICGKIEREERRYSHVQPLYPLERPRGWGYVHVFRPTLPCPNQSGTARLQLLPSPEIYITCSLECLGKALTELQQKAVRWRTEAEENEDGDEGEREPS